MKRIDVILSPLDRQFVSLCAISDPGNVNHCVVMGTTRVYMTLSPQLMTMKGYATRVCGMQQPNATPTPDQTRCLAPEYSKIASAINDAIKQLTVWDMKSLGQELFYKPVGSN